MTRGTIIRQRRREAKRQKAQELATVVLGACSIAVVMSLMVLVPAIIEAL